MEISEVREMSPDEILDALDDAREELMRLRFQITTGELTDHNQLKTTRQKIARIMTVLREREMIEELEGET